MMDVQVLKKKKCWVVSNLLDSKMCQQLIVDNEKKKPTNSYKKGERICDRWIFKDSGLSTTVWDRLKAWIPATLFDQGQTWHLAGVSKTFRFVRYCIEGKFSPHYDEQRSEEDTKSFFTVMVYLNTVPEEHKGRTLFHELNEFGQIEKIDFAVCPIEGLAVIFLQKGMFHEGEPLLSGQKYILRTDVMYRLSQK